MRLSTWGVAAVLGGFALYKSAGCVLQTPRGCAEVGCVDGVFAEAAFSDRSWPAGSYVLELKFDELKRVCAFGFPADMPALGSVSPVRCEPRDPAEQRRASPGLTRSSDAASYSLPHRLPWLLAPRVFAWEIKGRRT